jgi:hypothetical protein
MHYRQDWHNEKGVPSYCQSFRNAFIELGHDVFPIGEGHSNQIPGSPYTIQGDQLDPNYFDILLELDNGRNKQDSLGFGEYKEVKIPKAVLFTDSHGQPDLHQKLARGYTHVFFAVWAKRDLFNTHKSAHWCPNATDPIWFPKAVCEPHHLFGFFGSKGGLDRARPLQDVCSRRGWSCDIRQINGPWKPKFPYTAEEMGKCANLFNHGQKHDDPNLRVLESMAVGRPLITGMDDRSGLSKLFIEGEHYLGYEAYTYKGLEEKMQYAVAHPGWCIDMANKAYNLVMEKHLVKNRAQQMIEVFNGTP